MSELQFVEHKIRVVRVTSPEYHEHIVLGFLTVNRDKHVTVKRGGQGGQSTGTSSLCLCCSLSPNVAPTRVLRTCIYEYRVELTFETQAGRHRT